MAHFEIVATPDQRSALFSWAIPQIFPQVTMSGYMLVPTSQNPDGTFNFTTTEYPHSLELTNLIRNRQVIIRESIPVLPSKDGKANNRGRVQLEIDNASSYFSAIAPNAQGGQPMLSFSRIQDYIFEIKAAANGMEPIPLYTGKPIATPEEREDSTIFDLQSILWDVIDVELVYERTFGDFSVIDPYFYIFTGGEVVQIPYEEPNLNLIHQNGIAYYDEFGQLRSGVTNSDPEKIGINRIDWAVQPNSPIQLGQYKILFTSATDFELTLPDKQTFQGDIISDFSAGNIFIDPEYWNLAQGADPTGTEITWSLFYTVQGNPIAIIKNLLYKALTGLWGQHYQRDETLPIDFEELDRLEGIYSNFILYVSTTNEDNDVFDPVKPDKPIRIKDFCQIIADHVGCQLSFTPDGKITLRSAFNPSNPNPPVYTSAHCSSGSTRKGSHRVFSQGKKYDVFEVKYGYNPFTGNYAASTSVDSGSGARKKDKLEIGLPYYKSGLSDITINSLTQNLANYYRYAHIRLEMKVLPQIGITLNAGDLLEVNFSTTPRLPDPVLGDNLGKFWRIHEITKPIGGVVTISCTSVPAPPEREAVLCSFVIGTDVITC